MQADPFCEIMVRHKGKTNQVFGMGSLNGILHFAKSEIIAGRSNGARDWVRGASCHAYEKNQSSSASNCQNNKHLTLLCA